ncbi:MAG: hypothetical protein AAB861_04155 [Patescibacteria group bacterium]
MASKQNTIKKTEKIEYGTLPKSWMRAFGILGEKKIDAVAYQRKIRGEWENRIRRQIKLAS